MLVNRRRFIGGAAALGALAATAAAGPRVSGGGKPEAAVLEAIAANVEQHRAAWGIPGMTVCVVDRSGFAGFVSSGLADVDKKVPVGPDQLFQVGSISKMFTALAAWSLIDEGKLSPDVRLRDALKGLAVRGGESITLRQLLDHTTGLPHDSAVFVEDGLSTGFEPGKQWSYSNVGYTLAGMIAAHADGRPYTEMLGARVLKKLGMTNSVGAIRVADRQRYAQGYEPALTDRLNPHPGPMAATPWIDSDSPAGCVSATAGDMAIFLRFLLGLAEGKGGPVLSDAAAVRFLADSVEGWDKGARYGNGIARVEIDGRKYLHHTGGMVSFCSALHVDAEAGVAAFASANIHYSLDYRPVLVTTHACEALRAHREARPVPSPKPASSALEKPEQYVGVFTAAHGDHFEIVAGAGSIRIRRNGTESALQQAEGTLFATTDPELAVTGLVFDIENDRAQRAWAGEVEYARDPAAGYKPPAPAELRALAGRYDNDSRWAGPLYVYARDGGIWIGNAERLVPIDANEWRFTDETSAERLRFDGFVNGRANRLVYSGTAYVRTFG